MTKYILKSGFQFGGMLSTEQLATAFLFLMAIVIMYNQRIKYPEMLVEAGCIAENTGTVDVCFNTLLTLNDTCQQLCSEINQCYHHDDRFERLPRCWKLLRESRGSRQVTSLRWTVPECHRP